MMITERQNLILEKIIKDYIDLAQPISSEFLEKKHKFGLSPATIRIELQKLTDKGFLYQPHTSAGRIPTDRGYRFFVDTLFERGVSDFVDKEFLKVISEIEKEIVDSFKFTRLLTEKLSSFSPNLVLAYLFKKDFRWKEGWEEVIKEPEFREKEYILSFAEFLKNFEDNLGNIKINSGIKIYIGKENPFKKAKDFSIISSRCHFPKEEGIISLLGPKRMDYDRNIGLIKSLTKLLEEF